MIKIENVITPAPAQWEAAIRGMRNPMNSWSKMDSYSTSGSYCIGKNDRKLMRQLYKAGPEHAKFLRMLPVTVDITAPLYLWKEADTYKIGTTANSCSTMHKITTKNFTEEDFSCEHLTEESLATLRTTINTLNHYRLRYLNTKEKEEWWQLIQLLPSSYNQKRTIALNYAVLLHMYHQRKNHKLDEWHDFCDWVESLPCMDLFIGEKV